MQVDKQGRGHINILAANKLMASPRLYASFLLWLLSELFDDASKPLVDKVELVARLIRSKGVGVYFVTQNPADVPEDILGQLGNRVQHAPRAYTAKDQRAFRLAAETYRDNPRFNTQDAILQVGVGEAVTSFLEKRGARSC